MSVPSSARARTSSLGGTGSSDGGDDDVRSRLRAAGVPVDHLASSSAASSQIVSAGGAQPSRADQIVYRFYLKTVGVLVDGRVTHLNKGEQKKDRWFNIGIPDTEVHKADLSIYRLVSSYPPLPRTPPGDSASRSTVPPLLIAFILDTHDIPAGQTLMWNRDGHRVALDPCLVHAPAQGARRPGIVLERWTFRVTNVTDSVPSGSEMAPPTAYRLGIIHFRALYAFIRLLPAYRLFRRLRRLNTGLRLGIKLWGPEGYPNTANGLAEAWDVIERDLVGIAVPLERMIPSESDTPAAGTTSAAITEYNFAPLELFGNTFELGVAYRPDVDFEVEDKESILSERFVDMDEADEDWFTPTVARHRLQSEARAAASAGTSRPDSGAPTVPPTPPIAPAGLPTRQQGITPARPGATGSTPTQPSSLGAAKWGALAEGLPFATGSQIAAAGDGSGSPVALSPTTTHASAIPNRRLSAHSFTPFKTISSSPSTSILPDGPPGFGAGGRTPLQPSGSSAHRPGSVPRTSEFLSSSGRSFTHAQMANMMAGSPAGSPIIGAAGSPPVAPRSLSFVKQAVRQSPGMTHSTSSPFVPSSYDRETSLSNSPGSLPKRYSASYTQRRLPGSAGSPDSTLPPTFLRRQNTRESGLRHSIDEPRPESSDNDDVHAFLRALDSWTPPASISSHSPRATTSALGAAQGASSNLSSNSETGSAHPSPRVGSVSASGSGPAGGGQMNRTPLTRQHVDDMLKRMVGSFTASAEQTTAAQPTSVPAASSRPSLATRRDSGVSDRSAAGASRPSTAGPGLLSASRPSTSPHLGISPRSNPSPLPGSSLRHGSLPRTGALPFAAPPHLVSNNAAATPSTGERGSTHPPALPEPAAVGAARSLPSTAHGDHGHSDGGSDTPGPLHTFSPPNALSPQTTGGTDMSAYRRGPVLVRGGFGAASSKASTTGSSPSHSPVRDVLRPYRSIMADRDRDLSTGDSSAGGYGNGAPIRRAATLGMGINQASGASGGYPRPVGRTAPSSLGAAPDLSLNEDDELELATGSGGGSRRLGLGRYATEGTTSPAAGGLGLAPITATGASRSPRNGSPVVEGLMARLALAEQQKRDGERDEIGFHGP